MCNLDITKHTIRFYGKPVKLEQGANISVQGQSYRDACAVAAAAVEEIRAA